MNKFLIKKWQEKPYDLKFVLIFSVLLKITLLILATDKVINPDGVLYISAAKQILLGNFKESLSLYPMPFYPALITAVHYIIPDWFLSAKLISSAALFLSAIPLYLITKELFDKESAFWASLAFVVIPDPNLYGLMVIRGPLFILVIACAVYFALYSLNYNKISFFILSVLFTWIAMLCRVEAIVFNIFYFVSLLFFAIIYSNKRKYFIKLSLLWIIIPIILISIVVFFLEYSYLDIISINRFGEILGKLKQIACLDVLDRYHQIYNFLKNFEGINPFNRFEQGFIDTSTHYLFLIYFISIIDGTVKVFCPVFCIPLFMARKFPKNRFTLFLLSIIIAYSASSYFFLIIRDFISSRYLLPVAFFIFPFIGFGLTMLFQKIKSLKKSKIYFIILITIFFILPTVKSISYFLYNDSTRIKAGEWLVSQNIPQNSKIIAPDTRIIFHAGGDPFSSKEKNNYIFIKNKKVEDIIQEKSSDIIISEKSYKKKITSTNKKTYYKIKEFKGSRRQVAIYYSENFIKNLYDRSDFQE
jgi:hypothetical protein